MASYLDARAHGGRWLLRIEDLDTPREVPGSAQGILQTLHAFGFEWDGTVLKQSERTEHYRAAAEDLHSRGLTFECSCSRLQLAAEDRYPGHCRERPLAPGSAMATRLRVEPGYVLFTDRIQGMYRQDVAATAGDMLLKRRDRLFAYVMAVVIDDAAQGVTHVVRGADLLDNTPRQIYLQRLLGAETPRYAHVPVLVEPDGAKLAKSRRSVRLLPELKLHQLTTAFTLLGLEPPADVTTASLADAWRWGIGAWRIDRVPKRLTRELAV